MLIPYNYGDLVISWLIVSRLVSDDGAVFCLKILTKQKLLLSSQRVTKK